MIRILYLEDNKFDIDLTRIEFRNAFPDSKIDVVSTVEGAKKLLSNGTKYDVALLDLNLPDGNGIDILIKIREKNLPIAVVILTGSGNEESAIAALKAGADDYFTKVQGYLKKLPDTIHSAIYNYKRNQEKRARTLNVLYVEWNKPDIEFTLRHMQKYAPHIHIESVMQAEEALEKLPKNSGESCAYDVLLMDYRLPGLNALDTIKIVRQERKLPISIVLVTGHGNEDVAVQALKLGADEYLVKRDNYLFRLPSLLTGAFNRYELERQQISLRESEEKYRLLAENSGDVIFIFDLELNYKYVSPAVKALRGFTVEEALKQNLSDVLTPASFKVAQQVLSADLPVKGEKYTDKHDPHVVELEMYTKGGATVWTEVKVSVLTDENDYPIGIQGVTRDISKRKEAQNALLQSREEYRSFFEQDLTGDFISTVEGKLLNCNPAFLKILGFQSKEEALENDLYSIYPSREERDSMIEQLRKRKKLNSFQLNMLRRDGKFLYIQANLIGNFDSNNELQTIKGYLLDDTERKKAMDEIRKLSRAIEQSPTSVIITDTNGNIEYVNPRFSEVCGYSFEEAIGKNPRILKSGSVPAEIYIDLWNTITSGNTWNGELQNKRKDGTVYWENASISPIKDDDGRITHYLAVKEDISNKKKYEAELIEAKEKAEESDRLKSAFLANMSHEIRTPMNGILGFSSLLKEPGLSGSEQQAYIEIIEKSGARMLSTINDIMDISKIHAGQIKVQKSDVSVNDQMEFLHSFFEPETTQKGIQLDLKKGLPDNESKVYTDDEKLNSILTNLVKNAIKFTKQGHIELGYKLKTDRQPAELEFWVKDTGIGIPKDRIHAIFDRFVKADIEDKDVYEGSGLGLSITKAYVEMLGGKIWVESELKKGSVFYFTLPIQDNALDKSARNKAERTETDDYQPQRKLKIVIAEDDESSSILLEIVASEFAEKIIKTASGHETIEACRNNPDVDLVLMDIKMPGISGYEATRQIRQFNNNVVIIAQTAYAISGDKEKATNSGCNDYITKPMNRLELISLIKKYIK